MDTLRQFSRSICTFLFLALCIFASIPLRGDSQSDYFSDPKLFSTEELAQELKKKTLDMCWQFGQDSHFRFVSGNDEVYFEMQLGTLPDIYDDFVARAKHRFMKNETEKQLVFSYKIKNDGNEEFNLPQCSPSKGHPDEYTYIVADRRVIENTNPRRINQDELVSIIRDKNVLFYTGAGLSRASAVPAMNELNELLGLEEGKAFLFSLESALENPSEFASKIQVFHKACLFSPPTQAHFALRNLAVFKNIRVITENLDSLHETSGVYPYRIDPNQLRSKIGGASIAQFDYIVCVGLSYDDRGFLGWYKQQNPQGKIIAIDLNQPSYLGNEDFLAIGDIQEIVPAIQKEIVQ
jgi:NAD-dependent SIR2 family protein deacetylase